MGNAPTALLKIIRMIKEKDLRPALIVGMPVGFVSAAESKAETALLNDIPWIVSEGRKGGGNASYGSYACFISTRRASQQISVSVCFN